MGSAGVAEGVNEGVGVGVEAKNGVGEGGSVTVRVPPPRRGLGVGRGVALVMAVLQVLKEEKGVALVLADGVGRSGVAVEGGDWVRILE